MDNNDKYLEIDYLRTIATISVVAWHCFFCPMFGWGIIEEQSGMKPFRWINSFFIPNADMPLFTFLSGYLFYMLREEKGKYKEFKPFLINKIKRLLLPFLIFSLLIVSTSYNHRYSDICWGEGSHLWYCSMLFWCFLLAWVVLKINNWFVRSLCVGGSILLVFVFPSVWYLPFRLPLGVDNACYYFSFFAFGGGMFKYKERIINYLPSLYWPLVILYFLVFLFSHIENPYIANISRFSQLYIFIIVLWLSILWAIKKEMLRESKWVKVFAKYSFGIYVFHHWLTWNIVYYPPITLLLREHWFLVPLLLFMMVLVCSYTVTHFSLKTRLGRFLLI